MSRIASNSLLAVALVAALAAAVPAAAQSPSERAAERRARGNAPANASAGKAAAPTFPAATRAEPGLKASAKNASKLDKLFTAYDGNDLAAARPVADEILANSATNAYEKAVAARILGSMLIGTDDAQALAYMQQSVTLGGLGNNEHFESMFVVAQLQMQADQFPQALTTLDAFLSATQSQKPEHLVLKGNALYQMERYPEAIAVLKPLVESGGDVRPEWSQLLMAAYSQSGQAAQAATIAEQIAAKSPADKQAQVNLAGTYLQTEQPDKAAAVYERLRAAGQLNEDRDYRNLYALYLNSDGKERDAIAVINEGLEKGVLKPDHQTYVALGQAYFFTDQPGPAIDAYKKAAPMAPDGETYLNLAKVLSNEGRAAEAKAAAEQAIDKGVKNPDEAKRMLTR